MRQTVREVFSLLPIADSLYTRRSQRRHFLSGLASYGSQNDSGFQALAMEVLLWAGKFGQSRIIELMIELGVDIE